MKDAKDLQIAELEGDIVYWRHIADKYKLEWEKLKAKVEELDDELKVAREWTPDDSGYCESCKRY